MDDVIKYISNEIGPQEAQLLSRLGMHQIEEETKLSEILKHLPWRDISFHLERLGRSDIVEHIMRNTLITEGSYLLFQHPPPFFFSILLADVFSLCACSFELLVKGKSAVF